MKRLLPILALALSASYGCDGLGRAMTSHTGSVARAGEHELSVGEMVDLLAANPRIPAQTEVVGSVADLWVDYTILAELMIRDSTLASLDLESMIDPYVEQRLFVELRDQVVTQDTVIEQAELRQLFEQRNPALRVRARHILIDVPDNATSAQRDSARDRAEELRSRVVSGEDFAALAEEFSADPGSARRGGDLGWFGAGDMVRPFEEAAFRLQPGEVSPVVETLFGYHVIRVDERESPAFDEAGETFRRQAVAERRQESLDRYVAGLTDPADLQIQSGALDVTRDLARRPATRLGPRAASRQLVTWSGGALTARDMVQVLRRMPEQQRANFAGANDQQVESALRDVSTSKLVLADARTRGITVPQEEQDSIARLLRLQLAEVAREHGLTGQPQPGEARADAVERRVRRLLEDILAGRATLLPLGSLPYVLRQEMDWTVHERVFPAVARALDERRESSARQEPAPPFPMPEGTPPQGQPQGPPQGQPQGQTTPPDGGTP